MLLLLVLAEHGRKKSGSSRIQNPQECNPSRSSPRCCVYVQVDRPRATTGNIKTKSVGRNVPNPKRSRAMTFGSGPFAKLRLLATRVLLRTIGRICEKTLFIFFQFFLCLKDFFCSDFTLHAELLMREKLFIRSYEYS